MTTARRLLVSAIVLGALTVPAVAIGHSSAGAWRTLPPAPKPPTEGLSSVWTGKELLLFGRVVRRAADGAVLGRVETAAAYNPTTRTWRRLPRPLPTTGFADTHAAVGPARRCSSGAGHPRGLQPAHGPVAQVAASKLLSVHDGFALVVWTGHELIGWGGGCCGDASRTASRTTPPRTGGGPSHARRSPELSSRSAPGPATSSSRSSATPTLTASAGRRGSRAPPRTTRATNTWRRIARLPDPRPGARAIWDGDESWSSAARPDGRERNGSPRSASRTTRWPTAGGAWRRCRAGGRASPPCGRATVAPLGRCERGRRSAQIAPNGLAYDPKTNVWSTLPPAPLLGRFDPVASCTVDAP